VTARATRSNGEPADHESLRLWLRLFTSTTLIEMSIGRRLKQEFGSSLPRFDLLAQLERAPDGLRMTELSERTLTSGGNVTWLVRSLEAEGFVSRKTATTDRRAAIVRLTAAGRKHFAAMAKAHEQWIIQHFAVLSPPDRKKLHALLDTVKDQFRHHRTPE
jgi:DNA-binding MarR family transcriptional regulator